MKIFKKIFYRFLFSLMYIREKRGKSLAVNNSADILVLNPELISVRDQIPKIIWMYWEGKLPVLVNRCMERVKELHPDYQVYILNPSNIGQFSSLDFELPVVQKATPQQRADLIRFDLIYQYGGIWLDASTIVYEKLDWIIQLVNQTKTQSFSYYRAKNTTKPDFPVIENWLLASVQHNIFYKYWFDELYYAIEMGPKYYIEQIKVQESNYQDFFQEIGRLEYLVAYVACQKVMRRIPVSMVLINCDQNAFFYQVKNKWSKEKVLIDMAINIAPDEYPKLIKLAGKERKILDLYYTKAKYFPGSLLDI